MSLSVCYGALDERFTSDLEVEARGRRDLSVWEANTDFGWLPVSIFTVWISVSITFT